MWLHDTFFIWWTELEDPPTAEQLQFWARTRERGHLRYLLLGLFQFCILLSVIVLILLLLIGVDLRKLVLRIDLSVVPALLPALLAFMVQLHLRWQKNERNLRGNARL
jgi:hypothetical protein